MLCLYRMLAAEQRVICESWNEMKQEHTYYSITYKMPDAISLNVQSDFTQRLCNNKLFAELSSAIAITWPENLCINIWEQTEMRLLH